MAWRPYEQMVEGELDNTIPGKVTGWLRFVGMDEVVKLDLIGDFHRDIRGATICLSGCALDNEANHRSMEGFSPVQTGGAGDITAGLPPQDYVSYPYIEWYSEQNGRVVLELEPEQVEVIGRPIPVCETARWPASCAAWPRISASRRPAPCVSGVSNRRRENTVSGHPKSPG